MRPLRILLISWYFPPINDIGAVRVGELARYLHSQGDDVWVLTAERPDQDRSLAECLPPERVIRTEWRDIDRLTSPWTWYQKERAQKPQGAPSGARRPSKSLKSVLSNHYSSLVRIPDRQVGWLRPLMREGVKLLSKQKFDLIYASGPPFTTFLGASALSKKFGVPWVAEYRDGWSHYLYSRKPKWREALDEVMEDHFAKSATGIVTVSEPWAEYYRSRFPLPAISIYNGYDEKNVAPPAERAPTDEPLTISYFGQLYAGVRDPTVLYQALVKSGLSPSDVKIRYFGPTAADVAPLATSHNVMPFVNIEERVAHNVSLQLQRASDVLLLLQPPEDPANVPAKTFEYFAARRPILGIGLDDGIPAQLIRDRQAGFYCSDPDKLALQLRAWAAEKKRAGYIPDLPHEALAGLSRDDQFQRLRVFLEDSSAERIKQIRSRSSLLPANGRVCFAELEPMTRPRLMVLVDAEEEFDWTKPFSAHSTEITNIRFQHLAHRIFERYGLVPTYAVDFPVADRPGGIEPLRDFLKDGVCEIGAQLHPWVTPPHTEVVCERNSFPGNLPKDVEAAKLGALTDRIACSFGARPILYRAGRYGTGANTAGILRDLGYKIDCSVLPGAFGGASYATDYQWAPARPYWPNPGGDLLEIPVTASAIGFARPAADILTPFMSNKIVRRLRVPGVMARIGMFDRVRLSPEGNTVAEAKRLTKFLLRNGQAIFVVSYHSPSLGIGNTPYVRSEADRAKFLDWLKSYLDFFFGELNGLPATPTQVWQEAAARRAGASSQP